MNQNESIRLAPSPTLHTHTQRSLFVWRCRRRARETCCASDCDTMQTPARASPAAVQRNNYFNPTSVMLCDGDKHDGRGTHVPQHKQFNGVCGGTKITHAHTYDGFWRMREAVCGWLSVRCTPDAIGRAHPPTIWCVLRRYMYESVHYSDECIDFDELKAAHARTITNHHRQTQRDAHTRAHTQHRRRAAIEQRHSVSAQIE